jgi:hypothetical protein
LFMQLTIVARMPNQATGLNTDCRADL